MSSMLDRLRGLGPQKPTEPVVVPDTNIPPVVPLTPPEIPVQQMPPPPPCSPQSSVITTPQTPPVVVAEPPKKEYEYYPVGSFKPGDVAWNPKAGTGRYVRIAEKISDKFIACVYDNGTESKLRTDVVLAYIPNPPPQTIADFADYDSKRVPPPPPPPPVPAPAPAPVAPPVVAAPAEAAPAVAPIKSRIMICIDCVPTGGGSYTDLTKYVHALCDRLALQYRTPDLRLAPKDSPLAYGGYKGILAAAARAAPPDGHVWVIRSRDSELAGIVADSLSAIADVIIRGI